MADTGFVKSAFRNLFKSMGITRISQLQHVHINKLHAWCRHNPDEMANFIMAMVIIHRFDIVGMFKKDKNSGHQATTD